MENLNKLVDFVTDAIEDVAEQDTIDVQATEVTEETSLSDLSITGATDINSVIGEQLSEFFANNSNNPELLTSVLNNGMQMKQEFVNPTDYALGIPAVDLNRVGYLVDHIPNTDGTTIANVLPTDSLPVTSSILIPEPAIGTASNLSKVTYVVTGAEGVAIVNKNANHFNHTLIGNADVAAIPPNAVTSGNLDSLYDANRCYVEASNTELNVSCVSEQEALLVDKVTSLRGRTSAIVHIDESSYLPQNATGVDPIIIDSIPKELTKKDDVTVSSTTRFLNSKLKSRNSGKIGTSNFKNTMLTAAIMAAMTGGNEFGKQMANVNDFSPVPKHGSSETDKKRKKNKLAAKSRKRNRK